MLQLIHWDNTNVVVILEVHHHYSPRAVGSQHKSEEIVHFQESSVLHTIYGQ